MNPKRTRGPRASRLAQIGEAARQQAVRDAIVDALWQHGGSVPAAATYLGVDRRNLYRFAEHAGMDLQAAAAAVPSVREEGGLVRSSKL